jgi:hypothetical protein
MSASARLRTRQRQAADRFLYVRADGAQLAEIASQVDDGASRPGRSRGKVVVTTDERAATV